LADQFLKGTSKNDGAKRLPQIFNFQFSIINFTMTHYTTDTFFNGRIQVKQNRVGYPYRRPDITVTAVEVQEELAQLAISNVKNNHLQDRITVLDADMRTMKPDMMAGPVDLVVCNPPYRRPGSGRINPDNQRAVARHELKANLQDVMFAARRFLKTGGRFITIYTAERTADILCQMRADSIEPKCFHTIHSDPGSEAKLILVEGIKGGNPGLKIAPPLIVYDKNGDYTDDVQQMFEP
jgi:tRNA1Val (adenine37-N6)-methyltransferase